MFPVFMLAAFAAMFSTAYSVMDGFPRTFSRLLQTLYPDKENAQTAERPRVLGFHGHHFRVRHRRQLHLSESRTDGAAHRLGEPGGGSDSVRVELLLRDPAHRRRRDEAKTVAQALGSRRPLVHDRRGRVLSLRSIGGEG